MFSFHLDTLEPVTVVQLHDRVRLVCVFKSKQEYESKIIHWYKQTMGGLPQIMITIRKRSVDTPLFYQGFNPLRYEVSEGRLQLTILRVTEEDEGVYYCGVGEYYRTVFRGATFLSLKEIGRAHV